MDRLQAGFRRGGEAPFVLTVEHARRLTHDPDRADAPDPKRLPEPTPVKTARPTARRAEGPEAQGASARQVAPAPSDQETRSSTEPARKTPQARATAPATAPTSKATVAKAPDPEPGLGFKEAARRVSEEVKILLDITGDSTCEGNIEDFTKLFRDRYNRMRRLFRSRREMVGATTISRLKEGQPAKVVGLVNDVKTTKNGHRIIELEDDTGSTVALAPKGEQRLIDLSDTLLLDEVVGLSGHMAKGRRGDDSLLIIEEIVRPDLPLDRKPTTGGPGSVVFASDIHVGADTFLADGWDLFIDWLGERTAREPEDEGVRYLIINGDLAEGVGIYPGQEDELHIPDVFDQYAEAARTLARLPQELAIFILPGNHDAVRPAEPQPAFSQQLQDLFQPNVTFLANPCTLSLTGVDVLAYHGVSLIDYFEALSNCSIEKPVETMEEMLRRRHLCPIYGGKTPLAPEHRDHLAIERIPDIFVTGHVHAARTGEYRGTRLINASTWQEQTDYQRMMGFDPDPCKAFEVDLSTLGVTTWNFDHDEGTGEARIEPADVERKRIGAMAR